MFLKVGEVDAQILDMRDLCVSFGGVRALVDVGLAVRSGELFSVIGPNGTGKTTVLRPKTLFKCQLKPLDFSDPDYNGAIFDAGQQARLMAVLPNGVCDWTLPGVGQTDAEPTTFRNGHGGEPLGDAPVSSKIPQVGAASRKKSGRG